MNPQFQPDCITSSSRPAAWHGLTPNTASIANHFLLAKPIDQQIPQQAELPVENQPAGAQVLSSFLIGGRIVAHHERVLVFRLDFAITYHDGRQIFSKKSLGRHAQPGEVLKLLQQQPGPR